MHKEYTVYHIRLRTTETRFSPHPRASKTIAKAFLLWIKNVTLPYQWTKDVATIKPSHCSLHNRECWRTQERNRMLSIRSSATAAHPPPMVHPEGTQDGKAKDTGPRQPGCVSKEWLLQFPIYRRALNSLTTDVQFSLTNNILLMLKLRYFVHLIWTSNSLEKPCCWERLKSEEEGDRRWDGWMASQIQWMWIWANSGRYWRTGKPGVLQSMAHKESDMIWRLNNHHHNNNILLTFQLPGLCWTIPWVLPYLLEDASQSCLRCYLLGLSPQFCLPVKT